MADKINSYVIVHKKRIKFQLNNGLYSLDLANKEIKDIGEIQGIDNIPDLCKLNLFNNQITELKGLDNLKNLKSLNLGKNQITEIKGLEKLKKLKLLFLGFNQITEIKGLENLIDLEKLSLQNNQITEIKGLEKLINLQHLHLEVNNISEIQGLNTLKKLTVLNLSSNVFTEIKGIDHLQMLGTLFLANNQISKIQKLNKSVNLKYLSLSDNKIKTIEDLDNLTKLKQLSLNNNQITEIQGLNNLKDLKSVWLTENRIQIIKELENLKNLTYLYLNNNLISEINGLNSLRNLERLQLKNNNIKKIQGLDKLVELKELDLEMNQIEEIEEFEKLPENCLIYLANNKITNFQERIFYVNNPSKVVKYSKLKKMGLGYKSIPNLPENFKTFISNEDILEEEFINIGTHREIEILKEFQNIYFYNTNPYIEILNKNGMHPFGKIRIYVVQINSLKGFFPSSQDKISHFENFVKNNWDFEEYKTKSILQYKNLEPFKHSQIIENINFIVANKEPNNDHVLIVFPENSLPVNSIKELKSISQQNNIIIIGGLEHELDNNNEYINRAIIIDTGKVSYQVKQTPAMIYDKKKQRYIKEGISCKKEIKIKIFSTTIGRIAILICKDFLRLSDIISHWAQNYRVSLVVVPSLTGKLIPFYYNMHRIFNFTPYDSLRILFANVGEYGGSELFTLNDKNRIEKNFRLGDRDNIGEIIVSRKYEKKTNAMIEII